MGALLVVDDDEGARRALVRFLRPHRRVRAASTVEEAIAQIGKFDDWSGFLIDVTLGSRPLAGLDVLATARRVFPSIPAALVTAHTETAIINQAARHSASFLCKPFGPPELVPFLERVSAAEAALDERLEGRLHVLAHKWMLSPMESDLLAWLLAGRTRTSYLERPDATPATWSLLVGSLLSKANVKRTQDLLAAILRNEMRAAARAAPGGSSAKTGPRRHGGSE